MGKSPAERRHDEADKAFRRAWKLLDRIERRLERARKAEQKRLRQLGDGSGPDAAKRAAQLEVARSEITQIESLLTELSGLIAANARASSGQTVKDLASSVAAEIKDEAAEPPTLSLRRRNRQHRRRRRPADEASATEAQGPGVETAEVAGAAAESAEASASDEGSEPTTGEPSTAGEPVSAETPAARRRNRQHRPRRRPVEPVGEVEAAPEVVAAPEPVAAPDVAPGDAPVEVEPAPASAAGPRSVPEPDVDAVPEVEAAAPATIGSSASGEPPAAEPPAPEPPVQPEAVLVVDATGESASAPDLEASPFEPGPPPPPTDGSWTRTPEDGGSAAARASAPAPDAGRAAASEPRAAAPTEPTPGSIVEVSLDGEARVRPASDALTASPDDAEPARPSEE